MNAGPLIQQLFDLIDRSKLSLWHIGKRTGVASSAMAFWRYRSSPTLHNFVAVLNFLGYDLVIVERNHTNHTAD